MFSNFFVVVAVLAVCGVVATDGAVATDSVIATDSVVATNNGCKCAPTDKCWPSVSTWSSFNSSLSGRLIKTVPAGSVCYPGPTLNLATCASVLVGLTNSTFVADNPIALGYPVGDESCPAVNFAAGGVAKTCSIGSSPVYTVDATSAADVIKGVNFARQKNIRLVIRNTGHDITGRSTGYGSLEVWIRHLRQGITFQKKFVASDKCSKCAWSGSAIKIAGGYVWRDVYAVANKENVIVVGGGDPSVGCIGGWAQGGGHSPASRNFGLGADQILEAEVVLADGTLVTANACQNTLLFAAIRGGGGGTYGIVTSTTVKAHPSTPVVAQVFAMAPLTDANIPKFFDALAIMYSAFPALNDGGFSGYGSWNHANYAPVFGTFTTGYQHALAIFNTPVASAQKLFAPTAAKLATYNGTSLFISTSYLSFPSYAAYYSAMSGGQSSVGQGGSSLTSRFLDKDALTKSIPNLKKALTTIGGPVGEFTVNNFCMVSGGQVAADAADPNSGVNPAWRTAHVHQIVARGWAPGTPVATQQSIMKDITYTKGAALEALAPNTGSYMNEGNRNDPNFLKNFYGRSLAKLEDAKCRYDPNNLFYCPTCVGSNDWREDSTGRLCPA